MNRKTFLAVGTFVMIYTIAAWIIAAKVIFDFVFQLGIWATTK